MGQKGHWPICLCITSILGKPPGSKLGDQTGSSSNQPQDEYLQLRSNAFLTCKKMMLSLWKKKPGRVRSHRKGNESDICGRPVRHHPARSPLEMDAPGHHPPKKLGEISGVWRRQVQTISSLNNELWSTVSNHFQSKSPLCVQTPSYSLDPVAMWLHSPLQESKD